MNTVIMAFPGNEILAEAIRRGINGEEGKTTIRYFPDGESYVRILTDVKAKEVIVVCSLDRPDNKILPLFFLCKKLKEGEAQRITLIAPYLAYMRQDKSFAPGEAVTSVHFASLLSSFVDRLITIDPHLHRHHAMEEIYSIPCTVLHAADHISKWIKLNVSNPVLIGPDSESEQWVSSVAKNADAPFIIFEKERLGDREVKISDSLVRTYKNFTPVLVDDIISTAQTMIESISHLKKNGFKPVCIGVHGIFCDESYQQLMSAGSLHVVTCNTILHPTNQIDINELFVKSLQENTGVPHQKNLLKYND
ncbi:phosphoribosylpyrophosphate synthetase [Cytophagales bacterium WSM2-2]|nr:phosphoribosylpyrophosphate synthetase [Cytophagales bacterium WSM2-2]